MNRPRRIEALALLCMVASCAAFGGEAGKPVRTILCTTFPIYQFTRNVAEGSASVSVNLLLPAEMGCPHDYALTPRDMAKIADADMLIINGLGMEEFMGKPVEQANPAILIVDSSLGIEELIQDDDHRHDADHHHDGEHHHHDDHDHDGEHHEHEHDDGDRNHEERHDHEHAHHHHHGLDPHLYTSPALAARIVENIAARLCLFDPDGVGIYAANGNAYAQRLRALSGEMKEAAGQFANSRIIEPHGAFDYLCRDLGVEIVARLQPHGQELSASQMLDLLDVIKEKKPAVIVVEPQYPTKAGETLAAEAGIQVISLDSFATGPDDAPLDYYETVMRANLAVLTSVLGGE
jgi:zinc/manganese transport system substrate-binding protein/zinc transport system substrate-binding protein